MTVHSVVSIQCLVSSHWGVTVHSVVNIHCLVSSHWGVTVYSVVNIHCLVSSHCLVGIHYKIRHNWTFKEIQTNIILTKIY
jgi:hypothetical protein